MVDTHFLEKYIDPLVDCHDCGRGAWKNVKQ
jgi:hypothetical protein